MASEEKSQRLDQALAGLTPEQLRDALRQIVLVLYGPDLEENFEWNEATIEGIPVILEPLNLIPEGDD